jgi:hypothetical protein
VPLHFFFGFFGPGKGQCVGGSMCKGSTLGKRTLKCIGQLLDEIPDFTRPEQFPQAVENHKNVRPYHFSLSVVKWGMTTNDWQSSCEIHDD